jgi:hypothetical protein
MGKLVEILAKIKANPSEVLSEAQVKLLAAASPKRR